MTKKKNFYDLDRETYLQRLSELMNSLSRKPTIEELEKLKKMYALIRELQSNKGAVIGFDYTNWKGVKARRIAKISSVDFGECEWHEGKQYFLRALDQEKGAIRHFAVKDMEDVEFLY